MRRLAPVVGLVAVVAVLGALFGGLLPAFDLDAFLVAGRHVVDGGAVYPAVGSATFVSGHAFVYPYFVAWAVVPLAVLPTPVATGLWAAASVAAVVVACRLLGRPGALTAALVLAASTTVVGLQMGTLNAGLLLAVAAAWRWRDRALAAGAVVAVAAGAKLFLLPLVGWLVLTRRWRAAGVSVSILVVLLGGGWLVGPLGYRAYAHRLSVLGTLEADRSWSLTALLHGLGLAEGPAGHLAALTAVAVLVASCGLARRRGDDRLGLAGAVTASLLLSPIVWSSYLVLAAAPLLLLASRRVLALWTGATWVLVTPDVASGLRIAAGAAVVAVLVVAVLVADRGDGGVGVPLRRAVAAVPARARAAPGAVVASVALVAAALALLGPVDRSTLAAVLLCGTGTALGLTARTGRRPATVSP